MHGLGAPRRRGKGANPFDSKYLRTSGPAQAGLGRLWKTCPYMSDPLRGLHFGANSPLLLSDVAFLT